MRLRHSCDLGHLNQYSPRNKISANAKNKAKASYVPNQPKRLELLAPAGTREAFFMAIENGADAVYVGLKTLNARALARNFSLAEVGALTSLAHEAGVKVFVALNSLVKETELGLVLESLAGLQEMGVDALILQDLAVWRLARRNFPGLRLHASTLMGIHNSLGVRQAYQMGFKRVVLAREMTLQEIRQAAQAAPIEVEVFVHGAMCFTCSGSCLMSSYFGGRSSLRGRCVQPCRRQYEIHGKKGFYFSMLDLCGADFLPVLAESGVASIKIEGRLKPANYIAAVVRAYRMLLNAMPLRNDSKTYQQILQEARLLLNNAMGRPYSRGFFLSNAPKDLLDPGRTANTGKYLGRVVAQKDDVLCIKTDAVLQKGDRLRIVFPEATEQVAFTCHNVSMEKGLFRIVSPKAKEIPINSLVFKTDQRRPPILGVPFFDTSSWEGRFQGLVMQQKAYERAAYEKARSVKEVEKRQSKTFQTMPFKRQELWVKLRSPAMLEIAKALNASGIIVELDAKYINFFLKHWPNAICWSIPVIVYEKGLALIEQQILRLLRQGHRFFMVNNIGHIIWLQKLCKEGRFRGLELWSGYPMNPLNSQALSALSELRVKRAIFSVETDEQNLSLALSHAPFMEVGMIIFGYLPLFISRINLLERPERTEIVSPKGERFWWQHTGHTGCCLPDKPFSLFTLQKQLWEMGVAMQVMDLTYWPFKRALPEVRRSRDWIRAFYMGRRFNFADNLL